MKNIIIKEQLKLVDKSIVQSIQDIKKDNDNTSKPIYIKKSSNGNKPKLPLI